MGLGDGEEVAFGSIPLDRGDTPVNISLQIGWHPVDPGSVKQQPSFPMSAD